MNKKENNVLQIIFRSSVILIMLGLVWIAWTIPMSLWHIGARVALTAAVIALITGVILSPPVNPHDQGETR